MTAQSVIVVDDQQSILDDFSRLLTTRTDDRDKVFDDLAALLGTAPAVVPPKLPSYQLHFARQGLDAVAQHAELVAAGMPPAVAFVDIQMPPGIDGIETVSRFWSAQPDLEVVLCTAYSDYSWHSILDRLERRDQLVILRKPFDPIEVRQLAACLSEKWARGRALARRMDELEVQVNREVARRLELELRHVQKFQELGKLAASIAHEINTPMQYIHSNLEYIASEVDELTALLDAPNIDLPSMKARVAELPPAIADGLQGVLRVANIVKSVGEYSHTRPSSTLELLDVNAQVRTVAELVRGQYKHDAEIVLVLADLPRVLGNADALSRALLNLVVNAAQAVRAARKPGITGRITIRTRADRDAVHVDVEDTGIGIPRELWDQVFEPFFTTKPRGEGTGQGLALARAAIVELHRGTLTFESEPGNGTTFHVTLPQLA